MPPRKKPSKHFRYTPRVVQNWRVFVEKAHERLYSDFLAGYHQISPEKQLEKLAQKNIIHHADGRFRLTNYAHLKYFLLKGLRSKWGELPPAKRERMSTLIVKATHDLRPRSREELIRMLHLYKEIFLDKQEDIEKSARTVSVESTSFQDGIEHFSRFHFGIEALEAIADDIAHGRRDWRTGAST